MLVESSCEQRQTPDRPCRYTMDNPARILDTVTCEVIKAHSLVAPLRVLPRLRDIARIANNIEIVASLALHPIRNGVSTIHSHLIATETAVRNRTVVNSPPHDHMRPDIIFRKRHLGTRSDRNDHYATRHAHNHHKILTHAPPPFLRSPTWQRFDKLLGSHAHFSSFTLYLGVLFFKRLHVNDLFMRSIFA